MRQLILLRHAHAEPADAGQADLDRPLSPEGLAEAEAAGRWLAEHGLVPDCVLCSPARRTRETLEALRGALDGADRVEEDEALYLASAGRLLAKLQALPDPESQVLLVGHNPGLAELAQLLVERGAAEVLLRAARGLAPGAFAALRIATPRWRDLAPGCAELVEFLRPEDVVGEKA